MIAEDSTSAFVSDDRDACVELDAICAAVAEDRIVRERCRETLIDPRRLLIAASTELRPVDGAKLGRGARTPVTTRSV